MKGKKRRFDVWNIPVALGPFVFLRLQPSGSVTEARGVVTRLAFYLISHKVSRVSEI